MINVPRPQKWVIDCMTDVEFTPTQRALLQFWYDSYRAAGELRLWEGG